MKFQPNDHEPLVGSIHQIVWAFDGERLYIGLLATLTNKNIGGQAFALSQRRKAA